MNTGIGGNPAYEGLSMNEIAKLFYLTLFSLPSDVTFSQFRTIMEMTAYNMNDLTQDQKDCVSNAFFQVGIGPAVLVVSNEATFKVYNIKKEEYDDYTLIVVSGENET